MTRDEKIQVLRDIATGKKKVSDLKRKKMDIRVKLVLTGQYNTSTHSYDSQFFVNEKPVTDDECIQQLISDEINVVEYTIDDSHIK